MTWLEFNTSVKDMLTVDKDRLGLTTYIDQMLRQAVIELQEFISFYTVGHESVFGPEEFTANGNASVAYLPEDASFRDSYYVIRDPWAVHPLDPVDYGDRYNMSCSNSTCEYMISVDPQGKTFMVSPSVVDGTYVSLVWDGLKLTFEDADTVPFDEPMIEAVAEYVSAKIERRVNKDLALYTSYMKSFLQKRTMLYIRARGRVQIKAPIPSRGCCSITDPCTIIDPMCGIDCMEIGCDFMVMSDTNSYIQPSTQVVITN